MQDECHFAYLCRQGVLLKKEKCGMRRIFRGVFADNATSITNFGVCEGEPGCV